jgi:sigma-B regulation protein RsbU (phosphoserine phosphatase)
MSATIRSTAPDLRSELINWRERLESASFASQDNIELSGLLREVRSAIERLSAPESYGVCQVCHDLIGQAAMNADPLAKACLSCLSPEQLAELDDDLGRAWLIQGEFLPKQDFNFNGWKVSYYYEPAGRLSGDYCDLVSTDAGDLYFLIGDVAGKGVAASLLMSRLHAIFRSLITARLPVNELVARANHLFADTTMRPYYATLVCGRASARGDIEICNAGHCPPLLLRGQVVTSIAATGLPVGMFCQERYETVSFNLKRNDRLLLYTDGLTEARNAATEEYGGRLKNTLGDCADLPAAKVVNRLVEDMREFSSGNALNDDLTVMAIEMVGH